MVYLWLAYLIFLQHFQSFSQILWQFINLIQTNGLPPFPSFWQNIFLSIDSSSKEGALAYLVLFQLCYIFSVIFCSKFQNFQGTSSTSKYKIINREDMQGEGVSWSIFMFFNSSSGSGIGRTLSEQEIDRIDFNLEGSLFEVYFYNLRTNREKGFKHLKLHTEQKKPVIGVICGGDGTVMWVVSQMAKYTIDPHSVNLAIIPLGTGNDFSRSLGWGKQQGELVQNSFCQLKKLIKEWIKADRELLDLWEVEIEVFETGRFQKVEQQQDKLMEGKKICKNFVNYFSFGVDAEIGYEFDKHRTSTRLGNMAVYGAMGIKTGFQKLKNLGEMVEVMTLGESETVFEGNNKGFLDYISNPFSFNFGDLVEGVKKVNSFHNNQNLLALNINSYMAGVTDIWKKAKQNDLIKMKENPTDPSHSDGKIQFVSFSDTGKIGLQKTFGGFQIGFAEKIVQGSGPFFIKFREYKDDTEHKTFMQIDGEFIKVVQPKSILLKKSSLFADSKIRVLHKKN